MGFDLYSNANNHALDYSTTGLLATIGELDKRGLVHAGGGATLADARKAAYLETGKGRLALIACTTTWADRYLAADPAGRIGGRAGVNPLRYTTEYGVDAATLATLRGLRIRDASFRSDIPPGVHTKLNRKDVEALLAAVGDARQQAEFVLVSIHFHEGPEGSMNVEAPAAHIVEAAHLFIDAGVDAVLGHGPHRLHGVEIYRGKLILYSLGNLFFMLETVPVLPPECFENEGLPPDSLVSAYATTDVHKLLYTPPMWVSAVAMLHLGGGGSSVELWPVDLGLETKGMLHGVPLVPSPERSRQILEDLQQLSAPFGTKIEMRNVASTEVGFVTA